MANNFIDKFNTFINKYNTPRVFQILSTITFINLPILMFVLKVFRIYDAFSTAWLYGGSSTLRVINIFEIFLWNFGSFAESLAKFIVVVAAILGIVFMWLNRPKIAAICGGSILLIMLLSLFRNWDYEHYFTIERYSDITFYGVSVQYTYYFLWGSLALLAVFVVLSIMYTKDGPRAPKVVTVVQPAQQVPISAADEIKKLKELCDLGVISQEEFDAKKEQLLGLSGTEKNAEADESKQTPKETVFIGGSADAATLLKRAFMFLEDGEWSKADAFCEQVLNQDPENAQAYLGKLMAELRVRRQEDLPNCEKPFNSSNNFQKAVRFGDENFAKMLSDYIEHINNRNENTRLTDIYNKAVSVMNGANSESAYKEAAETFKTVSEFKDSKELAEQCLEKAEICRKDAIYDSAMSQMTENTVSGYEAAIKSLNKISDWKDADEQIYVCQRKIEEIKVEEEKARLERERQAEQSRIAAEKASKKFNRIIAITVTMIVACIFFVIVLINVIIPMQKHNKAKSLLDSGDYDAAYSLLEELGKSDEITLNKYERAKKLLDSGDYDTAYVLLHESGHDDEIALSKYERAIALLDSGDYDAAYVLLRQSGHSDEITSSKYDRAVALIDSGDYDAALLLLDGLDYKDSADKVDECKYGSAMELYNSQQYEKAYNAFKSINYYKDSADKATECLFPMQKARLTNVSVGSVIKFGLYEQDNDTSNGQEEIEWIVLEVDGDKALIISKYALDYQLFDNQQYSEKSDITWEECSLRTWLNETFYEDAFSTDHQEMIVSSTVSADENPKYSTSPGNSTTDEVFILSIPEVDEYFSSDSARICYGTAYCYAQGGRERYNDEPVWWWLRTPGAFSTNASCVSPAGNVPLQGAYAGLAGLNICTVRPAMWINLG